MVRRRGRGGLPALDVHALGVFATVLDSGSMTAAARRLGLTQPAVSMAIRQLEREMDAVLLDRSLRPLRATRAGMVLKRHAARLLSETETLFNEVAMAADESLPTLRVGLVDSFTVTIGAPLIRELQSLADELSVWSGLTLDLGRGLRERELDLLVTTDPMDEVEGLERHVVLHEMFVAVLPADAPDSGDVADLAALSARMPLVRYSARSTIGKTVERFLRRQRLDPPHRLEFDASETVIAMVSAGLGWAITTPLCLLQGRADFGRLRLLPLPQGGLSRDLYLVTRRGEMGEVVGHLLPAIGDLLGRTLRDAYADGMPWVLEGSDWRPRAA